jgi:hypothetical protein
MLMPNSNSCTGPNPNMYAHYSTVRSGLALDQSSILNINASGSSQVCSTFGMHPNLSALKTLYDTGDLLWVSNLGVLQEPNTNKDNWWQKTFDTVLFAHNRKYNIKVRVLTSFLHGNSNKMLCIYSSK